MSDRLFYGRQRVGFFGIGKSTISLMRLLSPRVEVILRSDATIDKSTIPEGINIKGIYEGRHACEEITEEIIYFSPSVRRERAELLRARSRGVIFSSELEEFFKENTSPVFAVSGSDGKSTTTTIGASLLKGCFCSPLPIGNIGAPAYENIGRADAFVAELSSFTLRYLDARFKRAVITNITPNHLNWHSSFEEYCEAKLSLLKSADEPILIPDGDVLSRFARECGAYAIVGENYDVLRKEYKAETYITIEDGYIRRSGEPILPLEKARRLSPHNLKNLAAAIALTDGYSSIEAIGRVAEEFVGLPHRGELIFSASGIDYIDSSIDTTPTRTKTTLTSLGRRVILILGGRAKGTGFDALLPLIGSYVKKCIIYGESREAIYRDIKSGCDAVIVNSFDEAVAYAISSATNGDTVLLSPAATSYDSFSSFEERGRRFKELITKHYKA